MTDNHHAGIFDCRPILCVDSVARSIDYYVNVLGFRLGWAWSNEEQRFLQAGETAEPGFALVAIGHVQIMLSQRSQGAPGMWLHLDVETAEQVDALHESWARNSARIDEPPFVRPWGMYEMRVHDPDGHVLRVSSSPRSA
ncbi:MAG: VOC family protein [Planctomycetaceae bacterium]|nr:VOC family protein [Planctomycetaceae bacterium]